MIILKTFSLTLIFLSLYVRIGEKLPSLASILILIGCAGYLVANAWEQNVAWTIVWAILFLANLCTLISDVSIYGFSPKE